MLGCCSAVAVATVAVATVAVATVAAATIAVANKDMKHAHLKVAVCHAIIMTAWQGGVANEIGLGSPNSQVQLPDVRGSDRGCPRGAPA